MRIAVLSVSAGAGHVRAAEAIVAAALADGHDATHVDVMTLVPTLFRKFYADRYLKVVESHPALWGYLYHVADAQKPDARLTRLREAVERLNTGALVKHIAKLEPEVVICTHFLPAQVLTRMQTKGVHKDTFKAPIHVVVTDFDVHALWVRAGLAGYCVAADEIQVRLRERLEAVAGAGSTPITVTGIPISPAFSQPIDRCTAAAELGIDPAKPTLLMMSGGFGVGAIDQLAERILRIPGDWQLIALAGKNAALLAKLTTLAKRFPGRLIPQGFTRTIERVMACADVAISKPGGLTTSECLAVGLPMIVISPIPGQEERNCDYLLEHGAALKAHDAAGLEHRVRRVLSEPELLARMRANAKRLGRADAAQRVLAPLAGSAAGHGGGARR